MSTVTPTLLPKPPLFPHVLPELPKPHPKPLPPRPGNYSRLNATRDLNREMDELSEEEAELEDIRNTINTRGYNYIIPIGRLLTQQEEKNDADEDDETSEEESEESEDGDTASAPSGAPSEAEGDDGDEDAVDLDASMEDLDNDEEGDMDGEMEDLDE